MEQRAKVRQAYDDGTAEVMVIRESACSGDCHKCSGCGAAKETVLFTAVNTIGAEAGDVVTVRSESGPVLAAAAVLYMVPLSLFFVGYLLGDALWSMGALMGCLAFAVGIALAALYDRKIAGKKETVYTITGYPLDSRIKGDIDLD